MRSGAEGGGREKEGDGEGEDEDEDEDEKGESKEICLVDMLEKKIEGVEGKVKARLWLVR